MSSSVREVCLEESSILTLISDYFETAGHAECLLALEQFSCGASSQHLSLPVELTALRQMVLGGRWDQVGLYLDRFSEAGDEEGLKNCRYLVHKQKYLETLHHVESNIQNTLRLGFNCCRNDSLLTVCVGEVEKVQQAMEEQLNALERLCPTQTDHQSLKNLLSVPSISSSREFCDWKLQSGRLDTLYKIQDWVSKMLCFGVKPTQAKKPTRREACALLRLLAKGLLYEQCEQLCRKRCGGEEGARDLASNMLDLRDWLQHQPDSSFQLPPPELSLVVSPWTRAQPHGVEASFSVDMGVIRREDRHMLHHNMDLVKSASAFLPTQSAVADSAEVAVGGRGGVTQDPSLPGAGTLARHVEKPAQSVSASAASCSAQESSRPSSSQLPSVPTHPHVQHSKVEASPPPTPAHIQHSKVEPPPPPTPAQVQHSKLEASSPPTPAHVQHSRKEPPAPPTPAHVQHSRKEPPAPPTPAHVQHSRKEAPAPPTPAHVQHSKGETQLPSALPHVQHSKAETQLPPAPPTPPHVHHSKAETQLPSVPTPAHAQHSKAETQTRSHLPSVAHVQYSKGETQLPPAGHVQQTQISSKLPPTTTPEPAHVKQSKQETQIQSPAKESQVDRSPQLDTNNTSSGHEDIEPFLPSTTPLHKTARLSSTPKNMKMARGSLQTSPPSSPIPATPAIAKAPSMAASLVDREGGTRKHSSQRAQRWPSVSLLGTITDSQAIRSVAFSKSGHLAAVGSNSGILRVCSTSSLLSDESPRQLNVVFEQPRCHRGSIYCLAWYKDRLLASGSNDRHISLLSWSSYGTTPDSKPRKSPPHKGTIRDILFTPEGLMVYGGGVSPEIVVTDMNTYQNVVMLAGHTDQVLTLGQLPGGLIASGGQDKTVLLWDLRSPAPVSALELSQPVASLTSSWESLVTSHLDGSCAIHDLNNFKCVSTYAAHTKECRTVRYHPKSNMKDRWVLSGSYDKSVCLTNTSNLQWTRLCQHQDKVIQCRWHPEGNMFATTGVDKQACFWSISMKSMQGRH